MFNNYVDDDAYPLIADTPKQMLEYLSDATAIIARIFRRHCLSLNFKANKTEAMISLVGKGAKQAMKELVIDREGIIDVSGQRVCPGSPDIALRAVAWYRHMGHATSSAGGFLQEAKLRAAESFGAYRSVRKRVVKNALIPDHVRISLCKSLIHSRLFYGAALWHCETRQAIRIIGHAYTAPIRESLGMSNVNRETGKAVDKKNLTSDAQVLVQAGLPCALARSRADRMKYACRLIEQGPDILLRLVLACFGKPGSWTQEWILDLRAVWSSGAAFVKRMPDPLTAPSAWFTEIRQGPRQFRTQLSKAILSIYAFSQTRRDNKEAQPVSDEFVCPDCSIAFASHALLCCHRSAKHAYLNPLRRFVSGSVCRCCSKQFHTYPRLYHHIRSRARCASYVKRHVTPMDEGEVRELLAASAVVEKTRDSKALKPPCVMAA